MRKFMFKNNIPWRKVSPILIGLIVVSTHAHEDIDLGLVDVSLDRECRARIIIENAGRDLPSSFYEAINPAHVVLTKGKKNEKLASLRALDRRSQLYDSDGSITIYSNIKYTNIPEPFEIRIEYGDEFSDFDEANNHLVRSMDCIIGKGQVTGNPVLPTKPDIALSHIKIDPNSCKLSLTVKNKNNVILDEDSYSKTNGIVMALVDLDNKDRSEDINLDTIDPQNKLNSSTPNVEWTTALPFTKATKVRVGLLNVKLDVDYSNNVEEVIVPEPCFKR